MNKKILLISSVLLTLSLVTIIFFNNVENKENNIISNINKNEQVINSNMITMMYETESGSGEYVETKDTTWPESGYIFNENLSGCENGGELEYNSINNTVNLLSNKSDQCYVYFDKYDGVWIDTVNITNVTGSSVILDVSATSENGNITTYYYSLNDSEYISTSTNPIVIENLNQLTEYNIKIYAVDSTSARSNIYKLNVSTTDISAPVINSVEVSDITTSGFTLTVNATSDVEIERYYYIIESENISGTSINNSFSFTNLSSETIYNISVFIENIHGSFSNKYNVTVETENAIILADFIVGLYTSQGSNGIYYHTSSLSNSARDNSFRYSGLNPNNYVCFGTDTIPCPNDNLYQIIGVFDEQVKLIKSITLGDYVWDLNTSNIWSSSDIKEMLNTTFLNNFGNTWDSMISFHTWKSSREIEYESRTYTASQFYSIEEGSSNSINDNSKIGLMYVSDYGFAANPTYWTTNIESYDSIISENWLYSGLLEWTITPGWGDYFVFQIGADGALYVDNMWGYLNREFSTRPCFYLNSDVLYDSGDGSRENPFRIKIN